MRKRSPMKEIATEMGFPCVSEVPSENIGDYADRMSAKFGEKRSREMLLRQIMYRKGIPSKEKNKYIDIYDNIKTKNNGEGVSDVIKNSGAEFIKGLSKGMGLSKGENK